jgi:Abnormal spindle-like microcephaly-assoc'd, ASPM-SPD-2-Hydin
LAICLLNSGCASYAPKKIAELSLSANSFQFNTVVVGQKATQTVKISNAGTAPLEIAGITTSSKEFSVTGPTFPRSVLPASTVAYTLTFAPTAAGNASGTLSISSNSAAPTPVVSLSGLGERSFANLIITPSAVSFGNLAVKTTSTQNVTLQNTGDISLSLQGVTIAGAGFGFSDLSPGFSLAPNQKVTFQVWFSPKVAGPASATLTLLSANMSSPGTLSMTGDGVAAATTPPPSNPAPAQHSVALTWNASTSTVVGYRVYRSESSGSSFAALNGTALNALTYTDSTVASGTTYYYMVTAVDSAGTESIYSNQVTAVIPTS